MMAFLLAATIAAQADNKVEIGPYYTDCPNGIAFISGGKQICLLRVGWVVDGKYESDYGALTGPGRELHYGLSAADGSYHELSWKVRGATIRFRWARTPAGKVVGEVQADRNLPLVLELSEESSTCTATIEPDGVGVLSGRVVGRVSAFPRISIWPPSQRSGISGRIRAGWSAPTQELMATSLAGQGPRNGAEPGRMAALTFGYEFCFGTSDDRASYVQELVNARARALNRVPAAAGEWGDFVGPISSCLHFSRVFSQDNKMIAHTVSRGWCRPDGQVLFGWDSFFNGLLACLDDPEGAKGTVRAVLAGATKEGFVPNFSGRSWGTSVDRSQPPVGAMCVWKIHQRRPDRKFLAEVYPKLVKWHEWWFRPHSGTGVPMRDGNRDGLLEWGSETGDLQNAKFESGLDDSPMFDGCSMSGPNMRLDSVDLSSLWAMDAEYLSYIAGALKKAAEAKRFRKERDDMAKRIDALLWNDKLGIYCDRYWEPLAKTDQVKTAEIFTSDGLPGLKGEYYAGRSLEELKLTRQDADVDFNWEATSPDPKLGKTDYSVRWTGKLTPHDSGEYVFDVTSDDGARLWLDGKTLVDDWTVHAPHKVSTDRIKLEAGRAYDVTVEYFQAEGGAQIHLGLAKIDFGAPPQWFSTRLSPCNFYPMIAGIPSKERAARMLKILKDPKKFWGKFVCPTITRDDPSFPDQNYWRGKIWAPTNYLMWLGLKRYAEPKLLTEFARKSVALFMRNWHKDWTCHENFLSNGDGSSDPHYTWGALLCLIGLESLCDIEPNGNIRLNGTGADDLRLERVPIGGRSVDVHCLPGKATLYRGNKAVMHAEKAVVVKALR